MTAEEPRYRSGLERRIAAQLVEAGVEFEYEQSRLAYIRPPSTHKYTPDFCLTGTNIVVEAKGLFTREDRRKMLLVNEQHPELEFRFVFSNDRAKLYKGSSTTYGQWCEQNGFVYTRGLIPTDWLNAGNSPPAQ